MSKIYFYDSVTSTLDKIVELAKTENLNTWDSVLAKMQTKGRGQMRRKWTSQEGNIFGAVNLPLDNTFATPAASVVTGAFFVLALNDMGFDVMLKWPNDLVYEVPDYTVNEFSGNLNDASSFSYERRTIKRWAKVGGILLEEKILHANGPYKVKKENTPDTIGDIVKDKILAAGVGINLISSPAIKTPASDFTIKAGHLYQKSSPDNLSPQAFWEQLMRIIQNLPQEFSVSSWLDYINEHLLWKDRLITFQTDAKETTIGNEFEAIIRGINSDGALLLETGQKIIPFLGGQIIKSPFWTESKYK